MKWPWQKEPEVEAEVMDLEVMDPDLPEAKEAASDLLRRLVVLGEEADVLLRRS